MMEGGACAGSTSVHAVLGIPELLELILDYAIHDENTDTRVNTLKSVRLVNKAWWTGVTNLMRKNKQPLFKLTLTKENSLNGTPFVEAQGKLLDRFVAAMGQRVEGPFPTFKLKMEEEFFRRENYDSLLTCLGQCGQGLVEVEMTIPENGGSLPGIFRPVDLPMMHKLSTTFTDHKVGPNLLGNDEVTFADSANVISLIQILLNGTPSLKTFTIPPYGPTSIVFPAPSNIELLSFPESITELELRCQMSSESLEVLTRNYLPNLLTLKLSLRHVSFAEGLFSKIMNNFSEHLRSLSFFSILYTGPPRHANFVRFPVMKKLTKLYLNYHGLELEEGHPPLINCFPKLEFLFLIQQTPEMLLKWSVETPVDSVKTFGLGLIDENKSGMNYENTLPFSLESIQQVHLSFPNITQISFRLSPGPQECGLKFLFMEMRQLKILNIIVDNSESVINSDYWDSVLTGLPLPVIISLRENDYWENVELKLKDGAPTITMLTALESLYLKAVVKPEEGEEALPPMISDLTFTYALMKMTKLKNLLLRGRFQATNQITAKWKNMGRYIEYSSNE